MKLPAYVRSKGLLLQNIPIIGNSTAQCIGEFIFLPDSIYKDLQTDQPDPKNIALLIHEETHRKRQKEMGNLKFALLYLINPRFRFQEELLATKEAMKYLKQSGIPFDFERSAKILSSYLYFWPVTKERAAEELEKIWEEV